MQPRIMKTEVLLTRRCNLNCSYCRMPANRKELPPEKWIEIFTILTEELGCPFYPIYGAEPLLYNGLEEIIKWFAGRKDCAYSILTNAVALTEYKKKSLLDAGLESITLSVDSLAMSGVGSIARRNDVALKAIDWALGAGLCDVQGTATVHRQNMKHIPDLVTFLSSKGVWFSFDFIHDNRGQAEFSKVAGPSDEFNFSSDILNAQDPQRAYFNRLETIKFFLHRMRDLKEGGYRIYQTLEWFDYLLEDPSRVIKRPWRCNPEPSWLTVDSDGSVLICDDYQVPSNIYACELPNRWEEFVDFCWNFVPECQGCLWCTHWMSEAQMRSEDGISQVTHGRRC